MAGVLPVDAEGRERGKAAETFPDETSGQVRHIKIIPERDLNRVIEMQEVVIRDGLLKRQKKDNEDYVAVVRLMFDTTSLSDEEIAERMKVPLNGYLPEWVAFQRRRHAKATSEA